jgi:hypothetical protein
MPERRHCAPGSGLRWQRCSSVECVIALRPAVGYFFFFGADVMLLAGMGLSKPL